MLTPGQTIIVSGVSKKGKERIQQLGNEWVVIEVRTSVGFSSLPGPWVLLITEDGRGMRWMKMFDDPHWRVIMPCPFCAMPPEADDEGRPTCCEWVIEEWELSQ